MFTLNQLTEKLAQQATIIQNLSSGISKEQAVWKLDPQQWSILEVINHLYDEEVLDFREHLECVLFRPDSPWSSIDPQGWVTQHGYDQKDLASSLQNFLEARHASLVWLKTLPEPDWSISHPTPFGQITAGDLCASWLAHDLLHLRQLNELHWQYTAFFAHPYQLVYAGDW
jgi:hypothetical protein